MSHMTPINRGPPSTAGSEAIHSEDLSELRGMLRHPSMAAGSVDPNTSQSTSVMPKMTTARPKSSPMPGGSGVPLTPSVAAAAVPNHLPVPGTMNNQQVMVTGAALERWGQQIVTWGKKHQGRSFSHVFENDQGYVSWALARMNSLTDEAVDFCNYALTRRRLQD